MFQTIPAKYIQSCLGKGHYFIPCREFKDANEFRYGYCLWNYAMASDDDVESCVQRIRNDPHVNELINSACVSCWVKEIRDEAKMWEIHGQGGAAIRIAVDCDQFCRYVESQHDRVAYYPVTYEGLISQVSPQFGSRHGLSGSEDADHHLFFHKRGCFFWENEFRLIVYSKEACYLPVQPELIESVTTSPLAPLDPTLVRNLEKCFGERLLSSNS